MESRMKSRQTDNQTPYSRKETERELQIKKKKSSVGRSPKCLVTV